MNKEYKYNILTKKDAFLMGIITSVFSISLYWWLGQELKDPKDLIVFRMGFLPFSIGIAAYTFLYSRFALNDPKLVLSKDYIILPYHNTPLRFINPQFLHTSFPTTLKKINFNEIERVGRVGKGLFFYSQKRSWQIFQKNLPGGELNIIYNEIIKKIKGTPTYGLYTFKIRPLTILNINTALWAVITTIYYLEEKDFNIKYFFIWWITCSVVMLTTKYFVNMVVNKITSNNPQYVRNSKLLK